MVNLGYDIAQNLPFLRAQAESRFTETFDFFTSVEGEPDPDTFEPTTVETIVAADVAGRFKSANTQGQDVESGVQFPVLGRREVHVAVGAVEVVPDMFVRCTASTVDAGLVGRVFRVAERPSSGQVTAWRIPVEEVS
jgi:hypothetical protein